MPASEGEVTGRIFDVRRFATHDGGGIRTTVFFKGCPLRCAWCHNPEGIEIKRRPLYFEKRCIHCGTCLALAKKGGVRLSEGQIALAPERAEDWEKIVDECPTMAIAWDSREVGVLSLLEELLHDRPFFRHGGGVTLSGGEPLLQPAFAAALLRHLQAVGVHTAIETALLVPEASLTQVLPHLDLVYADCKFVDEVKHRRWTGQGNSQILANLRLLLAGGGASRAIIRTPLIPTVTATEENIRQIAGFLASVAPDVTYELLNYNPLAMAKYRLVQRDYLFAENPRRFTKEEMQKFADMARDAGLRHVLTD